MQPILITKDGILLSDILAVFTKAVIFKHSVLDRIHMLTIITCFPND